jgi:recombinational DNA repair protein RecR
MCVRQSRSIPLRVVQRGGHPRVVGVAPQLPMGLLLVLMDRTRAGRAVVRRVALHERNVERKEVMTMAWNLLDRQRAMYVCRGCGTEIAYPQRFVRCPVCGIRLN